MHFTFSRNFESFSHFFASFSFAKKFAKCERKFSHFFEFLEKWRNVSFAANSMHDVTGGRYDAILELCGELCDLTKPIKRRAGDLLGMGTVKAKVYKLQD